MLRRLLLVNMMDDNGDQISEGLEARSFQFGIWQLLYWTAVTAVVLASMIYVPGVLILAILFAFTFVPVGPVVILFLTISFAPDKNGQLSFNHWPVKVLAIVWCICVMIVVAFCLLSSMSEF